MKKLILFVLAVSILVIIYKSYQEDYYIIPKDSIRIRIVPNSNSVKDQYIKKQVKANLEIELEKDLNESKDIESSRKIINDNIEKYDLIVNKVLTNEKADILYNIDYGFHYFPEKIYKGVKYEAGNYESLLITLGKAEGDNWWCVLFPPICAFEENSSDESNSLEYSFYIKEVFKKYFK